MSTKTSNNDLELSVQYLQLQSNGLQNENNAINGGGGTTDPINPDVGII